MTANSPTLDFRVDLDNCAREPIHIPGAIQPHGALLVLDPSDLHVVQFSENVPNLLGIAVADLLEGSLGALLGPADLEAVREAAGTGDPRAASPLRLYAGPDRRPWDGILHSAEGGLILELEPAAASDARSVSVFLRVRGGLARLQETRTLGELCDAMADEVRALTGLDRVTVYRFDASWNGEVIAEARDPAVDSFLGLHFPATDIPSQARELYRRNWLRLIADVDYRPAALVPVFNPATGRPLDMSGCVLRSVSPVHLEYLRNMGVGASMSISLLRNGELWGLIACHHRSALRVPYETRIACEFLGQAFSVQLGAVADWEDRARELEIASVGATLLDRMAGAEDWVATLATHPADLLALAGAAGAAICRGGACEGVGEVPPIQVLPALVGWLGGTAASEVFHTDRLPQLFPPAADYADRASGLLAIPLGGGGDWLLWFRPEQVRTVDWAGNPEKAVQGEADGAKLHPRNSFQAWRETVRGRSVPWQPAEIRAAAELRKRVIDIVLHNADRLARLNAELRHSNDELDAFTYIASHDLKEPLRGIHNYSAILLDEQADALNAEGVSRLQTLLRLTERMNTMIDSLLTYSRVGKLELQRVSTDLQRLLDEVLEVVHLRIDEAGIEIRIPRPLPTVDCDPVRAGAILQNLIVNAIKYNDKPDPWIEVGWREAEQPGGPVVLYVRDNGIGIPERHWATVFRIFRRLHARDKFGGGTGAGLTIARRLAERHGGRIWLHSVPGEGTTFFFTLGLNSFETKPDGTQS